MSAPAPALPDDFGKTSCFVRMFSIASELRSSVHVRLLNDPSLLLELSPTFNVAEALRVPLDTVRNMRARGSNSTLELLENYCRLRDLYDFSRQTDPRGVAAIATLRDAAANGCEEVVLAMLSAGVDPCARPVEGAQSPFDAMVSACEANCGNGIFQCRHAAVRRAFFDVMDPGGRAAIRVMREYGWVPWNEARTQPPNARSSLSDEKIRGSAQKTTTHKRVAETPPSTGEPTRRSTRKRLKRQTYDSANEDDLNDEDYTPRSSS